MKFTLLFSLCFITGIRSFIVIPEEVPSILSVLYSNIPPIKKGTDSRVGIGFRIGPNADFQVQFEIGPQTNTQPLGPAPESGSASKKRRTVGSGGALSKVKFNATNPSENWLNTWKLNLNEDENQKLQDPYQISDPTRDNAAFVNQLRQLYKPTNQNSSQNID